MNELTVDALKRRLDRLERENLWMKRVGSVVLVGVITILLMGQSQNNLSKTSGGHAAKVVEAQEFIVLDANGKQRARLRDNELAFLAGNGLIRANLYADEQTSYVHFGNPTSEAYLGICDNESGCESHLSLRGPEGSVNVGAGAPPSKNFPAQAPYVTIRSHESKSSLNLDANSIQIRHGAWPRLKLEVDDAGPRLKLLDEKLRSRAILGSTQLITPRTGAEVKTATASLTLFDKDANVIWKAP